MLFRSQNIKDGVKNAFSIGEKHSRFWLNKKIPEDIKKKISKKITGTKLSKEVRLKISSAVKKANLSLELRKRKSATAQGISIEEWTHFKHFEPYDDTFNKEFKKNILKRDNSICMLCGTKNNRKIHIHHIDYNKKNSVENNCVSLCLSCHSKTISNRKYWESFFKSKLNKLYLYNYQNETNNN